MADLYMELLSSDWWLAAALEPDRSNDDMTKLVPSRWIQGSGSAVVKRASALDHVILVASYHSVVWQAHVDRKADKNGLILMDESPVDREFGHFGSAELSSEGGNAMIHLGTNSFDWLVRALEINRRPVFRFLFELEETARGTFRIVGMEYGEQLRVLK